jgi:protein-serine/threonine kinase
MLKGLLMRRQSSQVSGDSEAPSPEMTTSPILSPGSAVQSPGGRSQPGEMVREPVYGDPTQDQGDEVRFYVELTKLDGLKDTYSIDIRRLKGNLRSYKFLYDCITECVYILPLLSPLNMGDMAADTLFSLQAP